METAESATRGLGRVQSLPSGEVWSSWNSGCGVGLARLGFSGDKGGLGLGRAMVSRIQSSISFLSAPMSVCAGIAAASRRLDALGHSMLSRRASEQVLLLGRK